MVPSWVWNSTLCEGGQVHDVGLPDDAVVDVFTSRRYGFRVEENNVTQPFFKGGWISTASFITIIDAGSNNFYEKTFRQPSRWFSGILYGLNEAGDELDT